jgi:hypothetical protein
MAWLKSSLLLNIQMYNMSSLHKYNLKGLINLIKIRSLFTTEEVSTLNLIIAQDSARRLA